MDEILKENFIESTKGAQKAIFTSCILSALLFVFAKNGKAGDFRLPILDINVTGDIGILMILLMYIATGCMLLFFSCRANDNLKKIKSSQLKEALTLFPVVACGSWHTRFLSIVFPVAMFGVAVQESLKENVGAIVIIVFIFSSPYLIASIVALERKDKIKLKWPN